MAEAGANGAGSKQPESHESACRRRAVPTPKWLARGSVAALVPALLAWPAVAQLPTAAPAATPSEALVAQSRSLVARFATRLQGELLSAMAAGGPGAAIAVCRDEAPRIASELSRESGAKVARTSLKFRNPANAPEPWQTPVLQAFDGDAALAGRPEGLEHAEIGPDASVRYMRAIPTGGLCLACHGTEIAPDVAAALAEHYPHDLARGYAAGDVRGAFSVTWPAQESP